MPSSKPSCLKNPKPLFFILPLITILICGCGFKEEQLYSKDEAERKFVQICKDEYNWDVNTKLIGNTFWIYIPYQQDILQFKVNRFPQISKFAVASLKGNFLNKTLYFEYQIAPLVKSEEDKGFTNALVDKVNEDFYHLLNVIYRVYFNAQQQPEFYVIVIADITNGIEIIYTIYNDDLKKAYNDAIASEEYYKRILQDIRGSPTIINDKTGRHLTYNKIDLGQFLAQQIVQRIRIKFLGGDSELLKVTQEKISDEILKIISYCLGAYEFQDFSMVILEDLSTGNQITKDPSSLYP